MEEQLLDNVEEWGSIDDPIDNFLTQAAFYVVPHIPGYDSNKNFKPELADGERGDVKPGGSVSTTSSSVDAITYTGPGSKMGPTAFTEFCKELIEKNKEDPSMSNDIMRRRTQAAMIASSKFTVRFREAGIMYVKDLMRVIFEEWGMPPPFANRAYGMLSTLIANNNALEAGGMYAHINAVADKVPGLYGKGDGSLKSDLSSIETVAADKPAREPFDSRFQRSALDPTARPPRLGPLMPIIHPPDAKAGSKQADYDKMWDEEGKKTWEEKQRDEDEEELPGGVWSQEAQFIEKEGEGKESLGVDGRARDPVTATSYISRRGVEEVFAGQDNAAEDKAGKRGAKRETRGVVGGPGDEGA